MNTWDIGRVNPLPSNMIRSFNRFPHSKTMHIMPRGHNETDPSTSSYFFTLKSRISEGSMFGRDSSSMVRSLIGFFAFRRNPVSKVYQHHSRNGGISEVAWSTGSLRKSSKNTAAGDLTPHPCPPLANGTGLNRTRVQWKVTNVYHHR